MPLKALFANYVCSVDTLESCSLSCIFLLFLCLNICPEALFWLQCMKIRLFVSVKANFKKKKKQNIYADMFLFVTQHVKHVLESWMLFVACECSVSTYTLTTLWTSAAISVFHSFVQNICWAHLKHWCCPSLVHSLTHLHCEDGLQRM